MRMLVHASQPSSCVELASFTTVLSAKQSQSVTLALHNTNQPCFVWRAHNPMTALYGTTTHNMTI